MTATAGRIKSFRNAGLTFDILDQGPIGGDPVVLLHGFPERSSSWSEVAPLLHEHGLRTFAPDQRGYSPRARPPRRRDYRVSALVGDVVALISAIGQPVHLVGHDLGSLVGWLVAAQHPDRVRTWTAVSVPHPKAYLSTLASSRQGLRSWYIAAFQLPGLPERAAARPGGLLDRSLARAGMTPEEIARFRAEIVDYGALTGALNWYRALPLRDPDAGDPETTVRVPTTMVWSDGDTALHRAGVERTSQWVDAPYELVVLPGVTHWIPTQAPRALAEAVIARVGAR